MAASRPMQRTDRGARHTEPAVVLPRRGVRRLRALRRRSTTPTASAPSRTATRAAAGARRRDRGGGIAAESRTTPKTSSAVHHRRGRHCAFGGRRRDPVHDLLLPLRLSRTCRQRTIRLARGRPGNGSPAVTVTIFTVRHLCASRGSRARHRGRPRDRSELGQQGRLVALEACSRSRSPSPRRSGSGRPRRVSGAATAAPAFRRPRTTSGRPRAAAAPCRAGTSPAEPVRPRPPRAAAAARAG